MLQSTRTAFFFSLTVKILERDGERRHLLGRPKTGMPQNPLIFELLTGRNQRKPLFDVTKFLRILEKRILGSYYA